jgi:hypothetical protein
MGHTEMAHTETGRTATCARGPRTQLAKECFTHQRYGYDPHADNEKNRNPNSRIKRQAASGKRQAASGKRQAASGKEHGGSGSHGAEDSVTKKKVARLLGHDELACQKIIEISSRQRHGMCA